MRSTEEQLGWEARQRPKAAVAAILAALLTLGGGILSGLTFQEIPQSSFQESLARAAEPGALGPMESLRAPLFQWYEDQFGELLLGAVLSSLGALAIGGALTFLAFAVAARRPQFPRAGLYLPIIGGSLLALARPLVAIGNDQVVGDIRDGPVTVDSVANLDRGSLLTSGQLIELIATLLLGIGILIVSLNAMRTGLLTRFMGVLGIIAGVLLAFPIFGGPLPVVQCFWLFALGILLLGRWPSGMPPAWASGTAMPWPSASEARAARGGGRQPAAAEPSVEPEEPRRRPQGGSKKKRKRRA